MQCRSAAVQKGSQVSQMPDHKAGQQQGVACRLQCAASARMEESYGAELLAQMMVNGSWSIAASCLQATILKGHVGSAFAWLQVHYLLKPHCMMCLLSRLSDKPRVPHCLSQCPWLQLHVLRLERLRLHPINCHCSLASISLSLKVYRCSGCRCTTW